MTSHQTALVIGAGIGGIALAARLARSGYDVTVLEKNTSPGGRCSQFLRDVGEDWRAGRVYLPANELARFRLTDTDLAAGCVDDRWRALMRFQIDRNRRLYAEAWPGIGLLDPDGRLAIAAAGELYRAILADIEAHDYDVFTRRANVASWRKVRCLWNAFRGCAASTQNGLVGGAPGHSRSSGDSASGSDEDW